MSDLDHQNDLIAPVENHTKSYELPESDHDSIISLEDLEHHQMRSLVGGTPTPWMGWMAKHMGEHETHKTGHSNPFIVNLFKHTSYKTNTDATPWCAATVSSALEESGYKSAHSASAWAYRNYGTACHPMPGCIVVFKWPKGGGHVAFVKSVGKGTLVCRGGNQGMPGGDAICDKVFSTSHAIAYRWPIK